MERELTLEQLQKLDRINGETKWDSITPEADLAMSGYNLRKVFGCSMNFAGKLPVVKKAKKPKEGR